MNQAARPEWTTAQSANSQFSTGARSGWSLWVSSWGREGKAGAVRAGSAVRLRGGSPA